MYVNQPELLKEGERKHTLSVFVADEAGMINRVAGVFARRGGIPNACVPSEAAGMLSCGCCCLASSCQLPVTSMLHFVNIDVTDILPCLKALWALLAGSAALFFWQHWRAHCPSHQLTQDSVAVTDCAEASELEPCMCCRCEH